MLKQLRPLSVMLALAAVLPAAQASVLTCDFNGLDISKPDLSGVHDSCGSSIADALTFSANARLANNSTVSGSKGSQYVRGADFSITLGSAIHVDGLTLDLTQPSGTSASVKIQVTGRNTANGSPVVETVSPFSGGNGSTIQWVFDRTLSFTSALGEIEEVKFITGTAGVQIDNLRFSLSDAPAVVPEPSLFGLTALALAAAGFAGRRRQNRGA